MARNKRDMVGRLRVEYVYDCESKNWGFVVPSLHIVGGGETREEAEHEALGAILFALEYYETDEDLPADVAEILDSAETEIDYVQVTVKPPARERSASTRHPAGLKADG